MNHNSIQKYFPDNFNDYELLDSGFGEKLERFGKIILARPEPQALWSKNMTEIEWEHLFHARFEKDIKNPDKGNWKIIKNIPTNWFINYRYKEMNLFFKLSLTSTKHIGIFPEQAQNWNYIFDTIKQSSQKDQKILNLFAYTGGASIAAKSAGAEVTHLDSVKQVVSWAKENMEESKLDNIRWIIDDAVKYVKREVKRGNKYNGIILDPPAYGRGPDGERWLFDEQINELIKMTGEIIDNQNYFYILNMYSMGYSATIAENLVSELFTDNTKMESGELCMKDKAGRQLPLGIFVRTKS